ncbi:neuropeptide-like protein 32 [Gigantopelta aegis]|uniref:neuropeptide-like protein 32 n=1 Tax=Gigantopelta aegis TaxID=1735272 RepID=UPI001B88DCFD|nr:neuropeptide-like protein 32 [Gigantopelta aegis]
MHRLTMLILSLTVLFVFAEYSEDTEGAIPSRLLRSAQEANDFMGSDQDLDDDNDLTKRDWEMPEFGEYKERNNWRNGGRRPGGGWGQGGNGWGRPGGGRPGGSWGRY